MKRIINKIIQNIVIALHDISFYIYFAVYFVFDYIRFKITGDIE